MFHFYNTCLNLFNINSPFYGGVIISSIVPWLSKVFESKASAVFFPRNLPALWTTILEAFSPVSKTVFYIFLQRIKRHSLTRFVVLGFIRISLHFYLLISNVKSTLSSISNGLPFRSVNIIIISSNSVL